ncbi:MAG: peptidoglycan-associated lipoprotein Pal [candidate division Zixibacteria bacterium]|nr:peptidoglycan-associated lipoprotein Pal [candidate division Zixibacteria bacterium]
MKKLLLVVVILSLVFLVAGCAGKKTMKPAVEPEISKAPEEKPIEVPTTPEPTKQPKVEKEVIALEMIHFEFDKYRLLPETKTILENNAEMLKAHPKVKVIIEGHCDERGTIEYNLALGEKRALSAKNYLVNLGISPDRLSAISYGKERPLDPRSNEEAWAKNRRGEFKIVE